MKTLLNKMYLQRNTRTLEDIENEYTPILENNINQINLNKIMLDLLINQEQQEKVSSYYQEIARTMIDFVCSSGKVKNFEVIHSSSRSFWGLKLSLEPIQGKGGNTWLANGLEVHNFPLIILFDNSLVKMTNNMREYEKIIERSVSNGQLDTKMFNSNIGLGMLPYFLCLDNDEDLADVFESTNTIRYDKLTIINDHDESEYLFTEDDFKNLDCYQFFTKLINNFDRIEKNKYFIQIPFSYITDEDLRNDNHRINIGTRSHNLDVYEGPYIRHSHVDRKEI